MKNTNITVFGEHEPNTLAQLDDVASRAERAALMADGHLGYVMPIGGVAAYREQVSVVGVGFDIACGNAAIRTDLTARTADLADRLPSLADEIADVVSFGMGRRTAPTTRRSAIRSSRAHRGRRCLQCAPGPAQQARAQLGTVGSGNHYVDVFVDETDAICRRALGGRGLATRSLRILALSQGEQWGARVPEREVLLSLDQPMGHDYWALMTLAGEYAYAGREWVARKVVSLLGGRELELVHNHHNFAWREEHDGKEVIVVRKGATPAFPGQKGFIGGSMGDDAVIVRGTDAPGTPTEAVQRAALYSTVHGRPRHVAHAGGRQAELADRQDPQARRRVAGDDDGVGTRQGRHPARRRARREPARLSPAA